MEKNVWHIRTPKVGLVTNCLAFSLSSGFVVPQWPPKRVPSLSFFRSGCGLVCFFLAVELSVVSLVSIKNGKKERKYSCLVVYVAEKLKIVQCATLETRNILQIY